MPRGRIKSLAKISKKVCKDMKNPKINDINVNDKYIYDPKDAYGSKLR